MNMNPPRQTVHVVDDDASFRKSLARLLRSHGVPVDTFDSAEAFLTSGLTDRAGCLVLDIYMPGLNGLDLQEALAKAGCAMPILFLTGHGDIPMSVRAMKGGAAEFLTKPVDEKVLMDAIQRALEENRRQSEEHAQLENLLAPLRSLTEREREVLRHLITGCLNKEIAARLGIVEKTVKVHRGRVLSKLRARSVADLVRLCQRAGIEPAPAP